ncbi:MAG: hypothetical protein ABI559_08400 [Chloroflexota bacterium]
MTKKSQSPSILRDVVAVAGLYRSVFWMVRQQLRHGPDWQQHLLDESMRPYSSSPDDNRRPELAGTRRN